MKRGWERTDAMLWAEKPSLTQYLHMYLEKNNSWYSTFTLIKPDMIPHNEKLYQLQYTAETKAQPVLSQYFILSQ